MSKRAKKEDEKEGKNILRMTAIYIPFSFPLLLLARWRYIFFCKRTSLPPPLCAHCTLKRIKWLKNERMEKKCWPLLINQLSWLAHKKRKEEEEDSFFTPSFFPIIITLHAYFLFISFLLPALKFMQWRRRSIMQCLYISFFGVPIIT